MSNDDWVKSHREMDITTRLLYWAQNEDMIDQYYTQRGKDLLEAEEEIQKLRKLEAEIARLKQYERTVRFIANDYLELSYDKAQWQRDDWRKRCIKVIEND
jgi:7-keto-8-aminopelargonate synthetase-like enzyme